MAAELGVLGVNREGESGGEGEGFVSCGVAELNWGGVEGVAEYSESVVCEHQHSVGFNLCDAVEGHVGVAAVKAVVEELEVG